MQVIVRSLSILRTLAHSAGGLSLAELSDRIGIPVSSAHRLMGTLESEGFVTRSTTNRRYFIGPASRELAEAGRQHQSPLVTAHPAVVEAGRVSGETIFLCEFTGAAVVCIAMTDSTRPLRLFVRVGQTMPLNAAASARVLLAWRDPEEVRQVLSRSALLRYMRGTPVSVAEVFSHLQLIRSRGYDICDSELDDNVWAVSAPIRSSTGDVVASVTLAAPFHRMGTEEAKSWAISTVRDTASEMSGDLGYTPSET